MARATEFKRCIRSCLPGLLAAGLIVLACGQALGQEADSTGVAVGPSIRAWKVEPTLTLQETYTDNVAVDSNKESDLITRISPGIRIRSDSARLKLSADYRLSSVLYADNSDNNQLQHALNAFGTLEAVEDWLFVDASGVVTQQYINALGAQSADDSSINDNITQTGSFRISPYIKGKLGGYADYQLRYSRSYTLSESDQASDTDIEDWTGRMAGNTPLAKVGWSIDGGLHRYNYTDGRETESNSLRGNLTYRHDPQLLFSISAGRESNDFALHTETYTTQGYGLDWRPTQRTELSAFWEKRFFGNGHRLTFKHRMRRSAIQFSDTRDVSSLPSQLTTVTYGTVYDLFFNMLASSVPDEAERAQAVELLLSNSGVPADSQVIGGFLTSQVSLQRRQQLSLLLTGVRNTVTLMLNRSKSESLTTLSLGDEFDTYSEISQQGLSVNWSHRLTPLSSLNVNAAYSKSSGTTTAGGENDSTRKQLGVTYTTKLGARTSASLSARRTEFESSGTTSNDYTEHAVVGTLSMTF